MLYPRQEIVKRYPGNPILTADDIPVACRAVYNSGITTYKGRYLMVMRVESIDKQQVFWVARSSNGYKFTPAPRPLEIRVPARFKAEYAKATEGMIYDPRVTAIGGEYILFYACHGGDGARIGMARTKDFKALDFFGFGSAIENRNAVLFPEKIGGLYWRLERPRGTEGIGNIWCATSPDLIHWGNYQLIARGGSQWEWKKIGAGAPPLKTPHGWLEIYHAVYGITTLEVYGLGAMLLDLKDPSHVLGRTNAPILYANEPYERVGETPNVVFTGGAILEPDGEVKIYYGACDTVQCVATARLTDLLNACRHR